MLQSKIKCNNLGQGVSTFVNAAISVILRPQQFNSHVKLSCELEKGMGYNNNKKVLTFSRAFRGLPREMLVSIYNLHSLLQILFDGE